jgi:hypothetical protein
MMLGDFQKNDQKSKINQKIGYPNNLKVFGSMEIKGPKMRTEIVSPMSMYERRSLVKLKKQQQYIHTSTWMIFIS